MTQLIICGRGPSAYEYIFPDDVPIMAISGGFDPAPRMEHFVSLDKPMHFPQWLTSSDRFVKHVADNRFVGEWNRCPSVRAWSYTGGDWPDFDPGSANPLVIGPLPRNHSLLFGVQVAARLGYTSMSFIGVDLLERELDPISKIMEGWYTKAKAAGIEWMNLSPISMLREWMPTAQARLVIAA